jgi:hypothetical protein
MVRIVPRLVRRFGDLHLLVLGLTLAMIGMGWLSRIGTGTPYFPSIAIPLAIIGCGMGMAFTPLTTAGLAGVGAEDAGAASGLVNAAQQLGSSLGLSVLVTVFASAQRSAASQGADAALSHAVTSAITGSAVLLAAALVVSSVLIAPARARARAVGRVVEA